MYRYCFEQLGNGKGCNKFFAQMGAFFLAIILGKIVYVKNNFDYPLFVVALVILIGPLLWLAIDPLKQVHLRTEVPGIAGR